MFSKIKKIFYYTLSLYTIFGFIILPLILKPQIIKFANSELNASLSIESIYLNPFIFNLELNGLKLHDFDNKPLFSFETLILNLDPSSLIYGAVHIQRVLLDEPHISLTHNMDKTFNLLKILKKSETVEDESNTSIVLPRIIVEHIKVSGGRLSYTDYTRKQPFEFSFNKIGFELKKIDTQEINASDASLRFYTTLGDGGFFDLRAKVLTLEPLVVQGDVDFEASKLYTEWKYIKDELNLEVADGKISFRANYYFDVSDLKSTKIENLFIGIQNLRVKPKNSYKDVFKLNSLYAKEINIFPFSENIEIGKILLNGMTINAKRYENGEIDWIKYLEVKTNEDVKEETNEDVKAPWKVKVESIALEKIALNFNDKMIVPNVSSHINELNMYAQNVTLAGEKPFSYQINMRVNDDTNCTMNGTVIHKVLQVSSLNECSNFDIVHYRPYIDVAAKENLKTYNIKLIKAVAGFSSKVDIVDKDGEIIINVSDANITLEKFKLNKRSTSRRVLSFNKFYINGVSLNTKSKKVEIQKVGLNSFNLYARKYKNTKLNLDNLVVPKNTPKSKKSSKEKAYSVALKHFALRSAKVKFNDDSLEVPVELLLDRIRINAYNIDLKKGSWLSYYASMRVNKTGSMSFKGKLRQSPLAQKGSFNIKGISLKDVNPYLNESLYVVLDDGTVSLKGKTNYSPSSKKADLHVESSFKVESLFVNDSRNNTSLFTLNELYTKEFTLELSPNRLYINELNLNAFYVNAVVDENRSTNFAQLSKKRVDTNTSKEIADTNTTQKENFPVNISKINVALGSARFSDFSIPIKFSTHIHDLNGVLYAVSNAPNETSYINISGEVDEYGSTSLKGSIDAAKPKEYTSLAFDFKNLDLNTVSGYSASYAGYEIDSGKLYLDLGYDILNSELQGSNSIMIKQIKLGDEVDDENVTVLPLGFVIGLLEDSDGIIEIDMPVEGNLDEPDFKYGALVLKTMGSLITRAVTSPFKFLGAAMGFDAEKLEYIEFEPGKSIIAPTEREKLDMLAKMMLKKPKILLAFNGLYDEVMDKRALQTEKLIDAVLLKSGIKNRKDHENAMSNSLLEELYEDNRDDDGVDQLQERLKKMYEDDEYERMYHKALINLCIEIQEVSLAELVALGEKRADELIYYLTQTKNVEVSRIIKLETENTVEVSEKNIQMKMQIEVK